MKRYCIVPVILICFLFIACGGTEEEAAPTPTPLIEVGGDISTPGEWPTLGFFGTIPSAVETVDDYGVAETAYGTVYTFRIDSMTYEAFHQYIDELKKNGFDYYDVLDGDIPETTYLPATIPESGTASWHGKKTEDCFVVADWYSMTYQKTVDLAQGYNCMLVFYGFNPYAAFEVTELPEEGE